MEKKYTKYLVGFNNGAVITIYAESMATVVSNGMRSIMFHNRRKDTDYEYIGAESVMYIRKEQE